MAQIEIGSVFSRLTVLAFAPPLPKYRTKKRYICQCVCGEQTVSFGHSILNGRTTSCGCARKEKFLAREGMHLHGMSRTSTYKTWLAMRSRCDNPKNSRYADWGGRGIKYDERWKLFENFYADMGERPTGTTLDRIDVNKDYTRQNCRWATASEQQRNRRDNTRMIEVNGVGKTMREWASASGLTVSGIRCRIRSGMPIERAVTLPRVKGRRA